eukprot:CAMPEP_0179086060 /NCGR_PEP_ID=MMETSP0796-20121207/39013_1 /TAXON_ID=73915 /ORGANISM="Pyrodinium bahamense, Strain pbaha01" /LENGTH=162 /DNA_ID=CAMNT_0020783515 /DNA_START=59 /DNA_END=545 /DNA_ORIENTATION=+
MKAVRSSLLVALLLPCGQSMREHRFGEATLQSAGANCGRELRGLTPEQRCNAVLAFILDLQRGLGNAPGGGGNQTKTKMQAANRVSNASNTTEEECALILKNLKVISETMQQCSTDAMCQVMIQGHLANVKAGYEREKKEKAVEGIPPSGKSTGAHAKEDRQ